MRRCAWPRTCFNLEIITEAIEYDLTMGPLIQEVERLLLMLTGTRLQRKGDAASQTLALYAAMKALSRVPGGPSLLAQQETLAKLVSRRKVDRSTVVTKKEKAAMVRALKLKNIAAVEAEKAKVADAELAAAQAEARSAVAAIETAPRRRKR